MSDAQNKMAWLNSLKPHTFTDDPGVKKNFITMNIKIRGVSAEEAEMFYEKESLYLKKIIHASWNPDKPNNYLGKCTTFSLYASFMDMAVYGDLLTLQPDSKMAYFDKRGYKAGRDENGKDIWEDRASLKITPYGELALRMDVGQIAYADPVVVVYDGDFMQIGTDDHGNTRVEWKSAVPRKSKRIIGSFVKITRPNGSYVMPYMLQEDIDRLAAYSNRENKGKGANALYGVGTDDNPGQGIDSGFLKAKTLKHAFGTFPRMRLRGSNSSTDDMSMDQEVPQETNPFETGSTDGQAGGRRQVTSPIPSSEPADWDEPTTEKPQGVTVPKEEEDTF